MNIWNKIIKMALPVVAGLMFTAVANSAIVYPALDIQQLTGDTGVVSNGTGLTMDGTAITVINSPTLGDILYDFADQNFYLTSDASGVGTLSVGGNVISASFSNLTLYDLSALGGQFVGTGNFTADLTYISGDMAGSITGGRIEGGFKNASGAIALGGDFTAGSIIAKLGEVQVVPVPAAVWLFGSGLLGLAGIARRKNAG